MRHRERWQIGSLLLVLLAAAGTAGMARQSPRLETVVTTVVSPDGTPIAVECAGAGPSLLIVHGGAGDRSRWRPLLQLFGQTFTACAMDRRGHGESGDRKDYSLQREVEDVAAVVNSRPGPVFVLGHSFGGVCALEAAFLTDRISRLVLYEPPLQERDHREASGVMERQIAAGHREEALVTFLEKVVMMSPSEVAAMRSRPSWPSLVASVESQIRQLQALNAYRFDPARVRTLRVPTLLLRGSRSASPELLLATTGLMDALPKRTLVVFDGQEHDAMDTVPQQFADTVTRFLVSSEWN